MRDILFKAKRIDNGEWVCWNIYGELCRLSGKRTRLAIKNGATIHYYDYIYQVIERIDKNTICQYTGLTDKNGNKIWENDIVKHYNNPDKRTQFEIGTIYWNEYNLRYERSSKYEHAKFSVLYDCKYEVIGNIFDNQDLLQ